MVIHKVQRISITSLSRRSQTQIVETSALPEGDPVYEVSVRGRGWQKEVQRIKVAGTPAVNETEIQVGCSRGMMTKSIAPGESGRMNTLSVSFWSCAVGPRTN